MAAVIRGVPCSGPRSGDLRRVELSRLGRIEHRDGRGAGRARRLGLREAGFEVRLQAGMGGGAIGASSGTDGGGCGVALASAAGGSRAAWPAAAPGQARRAARARGAPARAASAPAASATRSRAETAVRGSAGALRRARLSPVCAGPGAVSRGGDAGLGCGAEARSAGGWCRDGVYAGAAAARGRRLLRGAAARLLAGLSAGRLPSSGKRRVRAARSATSFSVNFCRSATVVARLGGGGTLAKFGYGAASAAAMFPVNGAVTGSGIVLVNPPQRAHGLDRAGAARDGDAAPDQYGEAGDAREPPALSGYRRDTRHDRRLCIRSGAPRHYI